MLARDPTPRKVPGNASSRLVNADLRFFPAERMACAGESPIMPKTSMLGCHLKYIRPGFVYGTSSSRHSMVVCSRATEVYTVCTLRDNHKVSGNVEKLLGTC